MPAIPEDAIHDARTCEDCHRVMFRKNYPGELPEGAVRYFASSCCARCWGRRAREGRSISLAEQARRTVRNAAALEAYLRARRARQRKAARRALMEAQA